MVFVRTLRLKRWDAQRLLTERGSWSTKKKARDAWWSTEQEENNNRGVLQSVAECLTQAHCDKLETLCDTFETQNDMLETMCDIRQYPMRKTGQDRSGRKSTAPSSAGAKGKRTSSVGLGRGSSHSAGLSASGAGGEPPDEDQKEIPREHYLDDVSSSRRSRQRKKERRRSISSSRSPSRSPSRSRSRSRSHERRHHRSKHSHRDSRRDSHSRSRSRVRRPSASASSAPKPRGKKAKSPAPTEYFREEVKPSVRDIVTAVPRRTYMAMITGHVLPDDYKTVYKKFVPVEEKALRVAYQVVKNHLREFELATGCEYEGNVVRYRKAMAVVMQDGLHVKGGTKRFFAKLCVVKPMTRPEMDVDSKYKKVAVWFPEIYELNSWLSGFRLGVPDTMNGHSDKVPTVDIDLTESPEESGLVHRSASQLGRRSKRTSLTVPPTKEQEAASQRMLLRVDGRDAKRSKRKPFAPQVYPLAATAKKLERVKAMWLLKEPASLASFLTKVHVSKMTDDEKKNHSVMQVIAALLPLSEARNFTQCIRKFDLKEYQRVRTAVGLRVCQDACLVHMLRQMLEEDVLQAFFNDCADFLKQESGIVVDMTLTSIPFPVRSLLPAEPMLLTKAFVDNVIAAYNATGTTDKTFERLSVLQKHAMDNADRIREAELQFGSAKVKTELLEEGPPRNSIFMNGAEYLAQRELSWRKVDLNNADLCIAQILRDDSVLGSFATFMENDSTSVQLSAHIDRDEYEHASVPDFTFLTYAEKEAAKEAATKKAVDERNASSDELYSSSGE